MTQVQCTPDESHYGNGSRVKNTYDAFDRIESISIDDEATPRYTYTYGANGQVARLTDAHLNRTHESEYDLAMRPKRSTTKDNVTDKVLYSATLRYNKLNHLAAMRERVEDDQYLTSFEHDRDDRVTEIAYDDGNRNDEIIERGVKYKYADGGLGRLIKKTLYLGADDDGDIAKRDVEYTYLDVEGQKKRTTAMITKIEQSGTGNDLDFTYEYDAMGNIVKATQGDVEVTYAYDKMNQLTRVNDPMDTTKGSAGTTWVYAYDLGGNILTKAAHAYTTDEAIDIAANPGTATAYTYDATWKDKLTSYDGMAVTYEAAGSDIGNPLTYDGWSYNWIEGRKLSQMSKGSTTLEYAYNASGLRTQKKVTVGSAITTTDYFLHGKLLM